MLTYFVFSVADDRNLCETNILHRCRASYTLENLAKYTCNYLIGRHQR